MMQALASDIENAIAYLTTKKTCEVRVQAGCKTILCHVHLRPLPTPWKLVALLVKL